MSSKITVNRLRAFVDQKGHHGNPTGIILDLEKRLGQPERQRIATKLSFTDTVFINNVDPVNVSFHNPQQETKFAGDALISTSYFVKHTLKKDFEIIICKGGRIRTWQEGDLTWIEADLDGTPPWQHKQLSSGYDVDKITNAEAMRYEHTMVWAWVDKDKGLVRSRTFLPDWGTLEDQGNGSGSMQLSKIVNRRIEISQGKGSVIYAEPAKNNFVRVGGRVMMDKTLIELFDGS